MRKMRACDSDLLIVLLVYSHNYVESMPKIFLRIIFMLASNLGNVTRCGTMKTFH